MTNPQPIKLGTPVSALKPVKLGAPVTPIKVAAPAQVATPAPETTDESAFDTLFAGSQVDPNAEVEENQEPASQEERTAEIKNAVNKVKNKKKDKKEKKEEKKEEKKYDGPREVKVYGNTLYIEEDPNVTLEQIREKIVNEYHYREFAKDSTEMVFIEEAGIVIPQTKFQKKG